MYKTGDTVIYSDLSPWELCLIEGPAEYDPNCTHTVRFYDSKGNLDSETLEVNECGFRENTPENREKYLS